jgi:hypothetical protein
MELELHELCWIRLEKGRILAYYVGETKSGHAFVTGVDTEEMSPVPESRIEKIPLARKAAASMLLEQQIEREHKLDEILLQSTRRHSRSLAKPRVDPADRAPYLSVLRSGMRKYFKLWLANPAKLSPK